MLYKFIGKFFDHLIHMFTTVYGMIVLAACQIMAIAGVKFGLITLGVVFLIDYITGLAAYYKSWKAAPGAKEPYFFQSRRARDSILKACTYFLFIGMSCVMWRMFFNGNINLPISDKQVNIIEIAFGICIAVECWSILENMKRLGFDLLARISKTFKGFWKSYKEIKNE